jgi:hypothetical protein
MDRHQVIQIRVSPEEKALIEEAAKKLGSPASTYMRVAVLSLAATDAAEAPIPDEPKPLEETVPQETQEAFAKEVRVNPHVGKDDWIRTRAKLLVREGKAKSFQAAYPMATKEWEAAND